MDGDLGWIRANYELPEREGAVEESELSLQAEVVLDVPLQLLCRAKSWPAGRVGQCPYERT